MFTRATAGGIIRSFAHGLMLTRTETCSMCARVCLCGGEESVFMHLEGEGERDSFLSVTRAEKGLCAPKDEDDTGAVHDKNIGDM